MIGVRRSLVQLFLSVATVVLFGADTLAAESGWVEKTIRFNLTVRNPLARPLSGERLLVYGPAETANQKVVDLQATAPFRTETDRFGNNLMVFSLGELAPYATLRISVTGRVRLAESAVPVSETPPAEYLLPDVYVESDHPDLVARSLQLQVADARGESIRRVYDWTRSHMRYAGYIAADYGALHAFRTRSGDCSEYAYLVAALARAQQMPARVLGGFVMSSSAVVKAADYHNWAEVFVDGRWQLVDAQKGAFMQRPGDYVVTRVVSRQGLRREEGFFHRFVATDGAIVVEMD